jgi:hypothetical protein
MMGRSRDFPFPSAVKDVCVCILTELSAGVGDGVESPRLLVSRAAVASPRTRCAISRYLCQPRGGRRWWVGQRGRARLCQGA